ncbi:hypothetical protein ABZ330_02205 [Streptomyces sp. NPDC006172]|uniref:hypothetical protein n=1 Tax=Streptomyces sp. NPDC006172 TaxID=3154470 RepID=UPI0033FFBF8B
MHGSNTFAALLVLLFVCATIVAALLGVITGLLARMSGVPAASAIVRGGAAFGGALTLMIAVLTLFTTGLK